MMGDGEKRLALFPTHPSSRPGRDRLDDGLHGEGAAALHRDGRPSIAGDS